MLGRYRDEHLASTEALLDAWFLVHALYAGSEVLNRAPLGVKLAAGQSLKDLQFAPFAAERLEGLRRGAAGARCSPPSRARCGASRCGRWRQHHAAQLDGLAGGRG